MKRFKQYLQNEVLDLKSGSEEDAIRKAFNDFKKSDKKQFQGKSDAELSKMAYAATKAAREMKESSLVTLKVEVYTSYVEGFKKHLEEILSKTGGTLNSFQVQRKSSSTSNVTYAFSAGTSFDVNKVKSAASRFIQHMIRMER